LYPDSVSKSRKLLTGRFYFKKLSAIKRIINIIPNSEKTKDNPLSFQAILFFLNERFLLQKKKRQKRELEKALQEM